MFAFLISTTVLVIVAAYVFLKQRYGYWERRNVPYPKPKLIFGNTGGVIAMTSIMSEMLHEMYNDYKGYAYVGMFNFWTPGVLVKDVELVKDVLIKHFNSFHDNWLTIDYSVDPVMAKNPFPMQGTEWKIVRTQLTPQYTAAKMKGMIPLMQKVSKSMVEYISTRIEAKSNCLEAKDLTARYTGDNVLLCAFGLEGKSFQEEIPVAFQIGELIASPRLSVQIKQIIGMFFPLLRRLLNVTFLGGAVPKVFWEMILNAIKFRDENNIVRKDYLDFIRDLKKAKNSPYEVDDAYAVAHAFTFFLDAFETSSISATFNLYELALNMDVQERAREEIDRVLEKYNGKLTYEALQEMEYLDNVMSESLRRHPVLLFLSKVCNEDHKFPPPRGPGTGDDVIIKKGTQIFLPVYSIHLDSQYYPDPEKFDPDRFTEGVRNTRPKGCFMGFGDGPRICLGKGYGLQQIKIMLVALLSEFEIRMNNKTPVPYKRDLLQVFNVPKDGVFVDFYKRSK